MKNATFKRFLSLVLALTMVLSYGILPAAATEEEEAVCNHTYENGVCTICQQNKPCSLELNCDAPDHVDECLSQATCSCTILCSETMSCPVCEAGGECKGQPDTQPVVCDGSETCAAETHDTTCACYDPCDALGCTEDAHHADCPYGQPCTLTEGCEKFNGHLGECTGITEYTDPVVTDPVAKIGDEGFATLADAVAAVETSATITLVKSVSLTQTLTIPAGKTVTLDLNSKTIDSAENGSAAKHIYAITNAGNLTITGNGTINTRGIYNDGTMTLTSSTINFIDADGGYIKNRAGTFTMNGGKLITTAEDTDTPESGNYDSGCIFIEKGTVVLNGGEIEDTQNYTYAVTVNGGTLQIPKTSTVTIKGQHGAVAVNSGNAVIQGGTLTCTGSANRISDHALYIYNGSLTVSGGTFVGSGESNTGDTAFCKDREGSGTCTITGGTFNTKVSSHLALGYTQNADGSVGTTTIESTTADEKVQIKVDTTDTLPAGVASNEAATQSNNLENAINDEIINDTVATLTDANGATGVEISMQVVISGYTADETSTVLTFDVAPHIQPVDNNKNPVGSGATVSETAEDVTFRLPMPDGTKGKIANVHHKHGSSDAVLVGAYEIQEDSETSKCYIELKSSQFSEWSVTILKDATLNAEIDGTNYTTLTEALNNAVSGDTIALLRDITLGVNGEAAIAQVKTGVTLDLNGKTLKGPVTGMLSVNGGTYYTTNTFKMVVATASASTSTDKAAYVSANGVFDISATGITIVSGSVSLDQSMGTQEDHILVVNQGATFTVPQNMLLLLRKGSVTVNGTLNNQGTIELETGATLTGDVSGTMKFSGGTYKTSSTTMVAPTGTSAIFNTNDATLKMAAGNPAITVISGTVTQGNNLTIPTSNTLTVKSGAAYTIPSEKKLTISGSAVIESGATLTCSGTIILADTNATLNADSGLTVSTSVEGYKVVYENRTYKLVAKEYVEVTKGATTTKYYYGTGTGEYANFEAVFKATSPATYTLSRNETFNSAYTMTSTGETIINLNGHTITGTGSITSGGSLTINNIGYRDAVNGKAYYRITLGAGDKATFAADGSVRFNVAPNGSLTYGSMGWTEVYPTTTYVKVCHMETPTSVIFYTNGSYSTSDSILLQDPTANGLPIYYITAVKNNTTLSNSFVYGSSAVMVFESNGFYSGLSKVIVTGSNYYKDLTKDTHFSADKGSTIVTLKNSYLKTLPKGNYTLTIQYQDGNTAATNFYVVSSPKPATNPQTGDVILTSVIIMVAAAAGLGVLIYLGKKKKK